MGRKSVCNRDFVLDLFARNTELAEISRLVGGVPVGTIGAIVCRARKAGDPRATLRRVQLARASAKGAPAPARPQPRVELEAFRRQRLARAFPSTPAELKAAIAQARVPVRRLRPGIATAGWFPSWLRI